MGTPRKDRREQRQPDWYSGYMALVRQIMESKSSNYKEASQQQVWQDVMVEEYTSIMHNDVWKVVPRPTNRVVVGSR